MSKLIAVAVAAALLLTPDMAAAHTDDELDRWAIGWGRRVIGVGLTPALEAEYEDWASRHPRYFGLPVPHTHPARDSARPAASPSGGGVEQWRPLVAAYFRAGDVDRALRIMRCESGGDPNIMHDFSNPASASGLFQHLGKYWDRRSAAAGFAGASIFDPTANVATGAWLRDQPGGWLHWRACL